MTTTRLVTTTQNATPDVVEGEPPVRRPALVLALALVLTAGCLTIVALPDLTAVTVARPSGPIVGGLLTLSCATLIPVPDGGAGAASGRGSTVREPGAAAGIAPFGSLFTSWFTDSLRQSGMAVGKHLDFAAGSGRLGAIRDTPQGAGVLGLVTTVFVGAWRNPVRGSGILLPVAAAAGLLVVRPRDFAVATGPATGPRE